MWMLLSLVAWKVFAVVKGCSDLIGRRTYNGAGRSEKTNKAGGGKKSIKERYSLTVHSWWPERRGVAKENCPVK